MRPDRLAADLVSTAFAFHKLRLWLRLESDEVVRCEVPGEEAPMLASVMGQAGEQYGLATYRGPRAVDHFVRIHGGDHSEDLMHEVDHLVMTIDPLHEIPDQMRGILRQAGWSGRRDTLAPFFVCKRPNRHARSPNRTEMRTLLYTMKGFMLAEEAGLLRPPSLWDGRVFTIEVKGDLKAPEIATRVVKVEPPDPGTAVLDLAALPPDLADLPRLDATWLVGFPELPGRVAGDDRTVRGLLVVDAATEMILSLRTQLGGDLDAAREALWDHFRTGGEGEPGIPREIIFTSGSLFRSLTPPLALLDVLCSHEPDHPGMQEVQDSLMSRLRAARSSSSSDREGDEVAIPETLHEWKRAEFEVAEWLVGEAGRRAQRMPRAYEQYFGLAPKKALALAEELGMETVVPAFVEWIVADYRPTRRSRSYLEGLVDAGELNPVRRALVQARTEAELSFWRVDACDPGATLDVECVLSGQRRTVHDRTLSSSDIDGLVLPLRLIRVGEYHFALIAGPPLTPVICPRAFEMLQSQGLEITPEGLREKPELLGRLWAWSENCAHRPPVIQNTEGEEILWHTASFRVEDRDTLVQALRDREDIDSHDDGTWTWLLLRPEAPGGGGSTVAGNLELIGSELVLSVNSRERLARARAWLEAIAGVSYTSHEERPLSEDAPGLDDRLPPAPTGPPPPELIGEVERLIQSSCMAWLDEAIPAFQGRTPRAMCATEEGRREVARMIRTYPDPGGLGGKVRVPREEMLRELGLSEELGA